ncbi:MAG: iron ABC transporter permease [Pseudomonadota bacterium]
MRPAVVLAFGVVCLIGVAVFVGDQPLPPLSVLGALWQSAQTDPATAMIVSDVRLPRAVLAALVGIALAVAGTITQAVMRNPLAEPGLLGINAGAALAALIVLVWIPNVRASWLPWAASGGALIMASLIYALSWRGGASSNRIILIGIGLSALAGAGANFISAFGDVQAVQRAMVWLSGSLQDSRWVRAEVTALWLFLPVLLVWASARELDLLAYGDDTGRSLGQRVEVSRALMIFACTLISGAAVAAAGLIAFVGLIAPHLARRFTGPGHAEVLPLAAMIGACLVLAADTLGRTIIAPAQLPAGLVAALIGAPFFGYLIWKRRDA